MHVHEHKPDRESIWQKSEFKRAACGVPISPSLSPSTPKLHASTHTHTAYHITNRIHVEQLQSAGTGIWHLRRKFPNKICSRRLSPLPKASINFLSRIFASTGGPDTTVVASTIFNMVTLPIKRRGTLCSR